MTVVKSSQLWFVETLYNRENRGIYETHVRVGIAIG